MKSNVPQWDTCTDENDSDTEPFRIDGAVYGKLPRLTVGVLG